MNIVEIEDIFKRYWKTGYGSVSPDEADFIQKMIRDKRPRNFCEIGTASGLSAGLIANFMEGNGGKSLVTIDHDNTFFGDRTKENGFLIDSIYGGKNVLIEKMPFRTALDVPILGKRFDMAFVDANHQHPWPIIDTISLFPFLDNSKIVLHHDLMLFRKQDVPYGLGPKIIFDQIDDNHKGTDNGGNIFYLDLDISGEEFESRMISGLLMPWTLRTKIKDDYLAAIRSTISNNYSKELLSAFNMAEQRYNRPYEK